MSTDLRYYLALQLGFRDPQVVLRVAAGGHVNNILVCFYSFKNVSNINVDPAYH